MTWESVTDEMSRAAAALKVVALRRFSLPPISFIQDCLLQETGLSTLLISDVTGISGGNDSANHAGALGCTSRCLVSTRGSRQECLWQTHQCLMPGLDASSRI